MWLRYIEHQLQHVPFDPNDYTCRGNPHCDGSNAVNVQADEASESRRLTELRMQRDAEQVCGFRMPGSV